MVTECLSGPAIGRGGGVFEAFDPDASALAGCEFVSLARNDRASAISGRRDPFVRREEHRLGHCDAADRVRELTSDAGAGTEPVEANGQLVGVSDAVRLAEHVPGLPDG
jgi:hypothetical protein